MQGDSSRPKSPAWLRAADARLTAAGLVLAPLTGGASAGAGAAAKAIAKEAAGRAVDSMGVSTGPHLHFEMREVRDGKDWPVDPAGYLGR